MCSIVLVKWYIQIIQDLNVLPLDHAPWTNKNVLPGISDLMVNILTFLLNFKLPVWLPFSRWVSVAKLIMMLQATQLQHWFSTIKNWCSSQCSGFVWTLNKVHHCPPHPVSCDGAVFILLAVPSSHAQKGHTTYTIYAKSDAPVVVHIMVHKIIIK